MSIRASKKTAAEVSIEQPIGNDKEGNEISLNDILGTDPDAIIDDINTKLQVCSMIKSIDRILSEREKKVIVHRYGILGNMPLTQRQVALRLGISRSYVSRIEKKALEKLRDSLPL